MNYYIKIIKITSLIKNNIKILWINYNSIIYNDRTNIKFE